MSVSTKLLPFSRFFGKFNQFGLRRWQATALPVVSFGVVLCASTVFAAGSISGRVTDSSGSVYFEGAEIEITETGNNASDQAWQTESGKDGSFEFVDLPPGNYEIQVDYLGTDRVTQSIIVKDGEETALTVIIGNESELIDNIIVYGQAAGTLSALNRQRAADEMVNVLDADSIGHFPDANVSEALQRVPGVFIERDQGEGRFVGIRGIEPDLNSSKINGIQIAAPERDRRSVALDVIPSDLIERLEVTKTTTPDKDGNAIGGSIDVKSISAFDRSGTAYKVSNSYEFNALEGEFSPKISGLWTTLRPTASGELGIAISTSWQDRRFGSENVETDGGWDFDIEDSGYPGAEEIEQRDYVISRKRLGLAVNIEHKSHQGNDLYLKTLFSDFSDQEYRQRTELKLSDGDLDEISDSSATWTEIEMDRELKDRFETQSILSVLAGGETEVHNWTYQYSIGVSRSSEDEPGRLDIQFSEDNEIASAGYRTVGETPDIFFSPDGADPANFELDEITKEDNLTEDAENVLKLDMARDLDLEQWPGKVQFGIAIRQREKKDDVNVTIFDGGFPADPTLAEFVSGSNIDYGLGSIGPKVDVVRLSSWVRSNLELFDVDSDETMLSSARDYVISEDILAGYLLHRINRSPYRLVYGLRYEQTDSTSNGFQSIEDNGDPVVMPVSYSKSYGHLLPSAVFRYKRSKELILRAGFSRTISRPSFGHSTPSPGKIEIDDEDLEIEAGNVNLEPYVSTNLDFSFEFYPAESLSFMSIGLFYKNIADFIFPADVSEVADVSQWTGSLDLSEVTDIEAIQPLNGESASLWGIEASLTRRLSILGQWGENFIVTVNGTLTRSQADLGLGSGAGRASETELPRQASIVGNAILGYESGPIHFRVAAAYKGSRILEIDLGDERGDLIQDPTLQLDVTVQYDIQPSLQLAFNAKNLTESRFYAYHGNTRYNGQYEEYGRSFVIGFTYRNL